MGPLHTLPISSAFNSSEDYVASLLDFVTTSQLLRTLCGGVHILDFFTRTPDLYSLVLAKEWRTYFAKHEIMDILDLLMREDLDELSRGPDANWRGGPVPPLSLVSYIQVIRKHSLCRDFVPIKINGATNAESHGLARSVALGMKTKKIHEVDHFARYVERLTAHIAGSRKQDITHLVDFGSGQGYLPRCLASPPYNKHTIAVESKQHNIDGARNWDIMANLAPKPVVMRNKKEFRAANGNVKGVEGEMPVLESDILVSGGRGSGFKHPGLPTNAPNTESATLQLSAEGAGSIQYIEHWIKDGDLSSVIHQIVDQDAIHQISDNSMSQRGIDPSFLGSKVALKDDNKASDPSLMVISLHSCGNLVHHGIRSLLLNPAVSAVALIGCCYNLLTERLGPATYKIPSLRSLHPRLDTTSNAYDPHGFPMSKRLCAYDNAAGKGVRLNITARMMAVQAPQNWGQKDSEAFFTRHFYRALLQRLFLDRGIVEPPATQNDDSVGNSSPLGWSGGGGTQPIILGSLRKSCYANFTSYVRGAQTKLEQDPERATFFREKLQTLTDAEIMDYEERYRERKKELSVIWSLMAFSAAVIEATIVVDRWQFLREQDEVSEAWVEPVFDYKQSPRNLVVVGVKR